MTELIKWGIPPIEKIHEAFSAIVDGRVTLHDGFAKVKSSDLKKEYTIEWNGNIYSSNDNSSYFQKYIGYPVIAVLMAQKKLEYEEEITKHFRDIKWKELNTKHKNKYAVVVALILEELQSKGIDTGLINEEVNKIYGQIKTIDMLYKRSRHLPPK